MISLEHQCFWREQMEAGGLAGNDNQGATGGFGKSNTQKAVGKTLVSTAVTNKQRDQIEQYAADSENVGSALMTMDNTLNQLQSDIRDLGNCLKRTAFATQKLQSVQKAIGKTLRDALQEEKRVMMLKERRITELNNKLALVESKQKRIICGYKAYKAGRFVLLLVLVWAVVMSALFGSAE